ncbi:phosphate ABC transporter substrate-binding protein [Novosphingobium flavum]|uniref:Phosphate ABC transporter substrate-binding protein n=2 Tax=Novosphingobium flavum TaxID=1778672 RepID=A0A7X1FPW9_9SPHN|nr:phosphate ABC transporter substrate-binding protein [Novosphingobium flavum]
MTTLRTNLAEYPLTAALRDGRVTSPIVTLDCCGPKAANKGFKPMLREHAYDCGELAIVTYLQAKCYGKPWVLLPAPVLGRFQHHCAGYNSEFGDVSPKDIEGKEVGVRTYAQTTGLWVRGVLQHEYGVDLDKVTWITSEDGHLAEYQDPPNCRRALEGRKIPEMMMAGDVTAALLGNEMPKDDRVRTLIPDPHKAAAEWFEREGLIPINHIFVVHENISRQRPDIVAEIYRMICESRALAPVEALKTQPPMGIELNRKGLQLAIDWSFEQKVIPRKLSVDELFDDVTGALI